MKVFIQCDKSHMPYNKNAYTAMEGFKQMGFETVCFYEKEELKKANPEDIVVGGVGRVKGHLENLGRPVKDIDYPEELEKYLGRKVWKSEVSEILHGNVPLPVFVKPVEGKLFTGCLVSTEKDLIGKVAPGENFEVYYSEPAELSAEFRCYVRYNKILDIRRYKGALDVFYDYSVICSAVKDYKTAPAAYAIDFGVTKNGETVLIEVNDGYSLGNYGLDSLLYAKLLSARWAEMTGTEDECKW